MTSDCVATGDGVGHGRSPGDATRTLHRLTSYTPELDWSPAGRGPRVVSDLEVNDLSRLPRFYKRYMEELDRVLLPRELPATAAPAMRVMGGTAEVPRGELDLAQLSRILHLSCGVMRTTQRPYGLYLFRAAGSAGGRFPLEVYVAVPDGHVLPAGVYWYPRRSTRCSTSARHHAARCLRWW